MEEKKNVNKGLIVLVIILLLACIGMGSYIAYDKFLNKETSNNKETKVEKTNKEKNETPKEENNGLTQEEIDRGCVICDSAGGKCCPT